MSFHVICSTADGNETKEFSNWEEAHHYANEWMDGFTHWNHRHFNNVETSEYVNLWKTRKGEVVKIQEINSDEIDESDEEAALGYPNCPNCADQASIAAPGQTTLCKTHDDEQHYSEMGNFFDDQINDFHITSFLPFCSRCGKDAPDYVIVMHDSKMNPLIFAACVDCRDELTLKQNAARAAQERFGA